MVIVAPLDFDNERSSWTSDDCVPSMVSTPDPQTTELLTLVLKNTLAVAPSTWTLQPFGRVVELPCAFVTCIAALSPTSFAAAKHASAVLSVFGQDGPWVHRPAYDQIVQGASGVMSITGDSESAPLRVG